MSKDGFTILISAILGLAIGSFLNVLIARIPKKESIIKPRSRCPKCETPIREFDNIPVISWILLRGKCRSCKEPISIRYPIVEAGTAAAFALVAWKAELGGHVGWSVYLPAYLALTGSLIAVAVIDFDTKLIHKRLYYPSLLIFSVLLVGATAIEGDWRRLQDGVLCGCAAFLFFFLTNWFYPKGMGFGDVRLSFLLGLSLGFIRPLVAFVGLAGGFFYGATFGLAIMVAARKGLRTEIPFGPWLVMGTMTGIIWGIPLAHQIFPSV